MAFSESDLEFMKLAMQVAKEGVSSGQSPFGACIVDDSGRVVALAHNEVVKTTDITAHAEVQAIRKACLELNRIDLSGCTIYSTCEPCPMCFAACHWARIERIVFGATIDDAQGAGFNELTISNEVMREIGGSKVQIESGCLAAENKALFQAYIALPNRVIY